MRSPASAPLASARLGYQPELDGIRGLAIIAVLAHNFEWGWLPGGHFGVDVFFALSGFLITTLLLEEFFLSGRIALRRFFYRRCVRLYPALVCLVGVSTVFSLKFHPETDPAYTFAIGGGVLAYVANWLQVIESHDWFGGMPHTWSLAVEAQFYVFWACLLTWLVHRFDPAKDRGRVIRLLSYVAIGFAVASAGWRAILWADDAEWLRTYLGTDTRLDGLFFGVLAALVRLHTQQKSRPSSEPVSGATNTIAGSLIGACCLGGLILLLVFVPARSALPGLVGFSFASLVTCGLILISLRQPASWLSLGLRFPLLAWIGKISYSLYIWHLPVGRFFNSARLASFGLPSWAAESLRLLIAVAVSAVSYHLIERSFLRLKDRFKSPLPPVAIS